MSMTMIILLPVAVGFGLLYWSSFLDSEEYAILGLGFRLMFLPLAFLSIHFAIIDATIVYASNAVLVEQLSNFAEYLGYLMFVVGLFILYTLIRSIINWFVVRKKSKEEERHG